MYLLIAVYHVYSFFIIGFNFLHWTYNNTISEVCGYLLTSFWGYIFYTLKEINIHSEILITSNNIQV